MMQHTIAVVSVVYYQFYSTKYTLAYFYSSNVPLTIRHCIVLLTRCVTSRPAKKGKVVIT